MKRDVAFSMDYTVPLSCPVLDGIIKQIHWGVERENASVIISIQETSRSQDRLRIR